MAITLINSLATQPPGTNGGTSAAIDTSGADFLLLGVVSYAFAAAPTVADSKSNTWAPLTAHTSGQTRVCWHYVANASVGSGHDFTASSSTSYLAFAVLAFSGVKLAAPFDQESAAGIVAATSAAAGSVTPSEDNELIASLIGWDTANSGYSIDSGFSIAQSLTFTAAPAFGVGVAYKVQGAAAAVDPAWSWTASSSGAITSATFKAAAAAGNPWYYYAQQRLSI